MSSDDDVTEDPTLPREVVDIFIRMNGGEVSEDEIALFESWQKENPGLLPAYDELEGLWEDLGILLRDVPYSPGPDVAASHGRERRDTENKRRWFRHPFRRGAVAAAAILLLAGLALLLQWDKSGPEWYRTGRGERFVLNLQDGSVVQLNSLTEIAVDFDDRVRSVLLNRGEALFEVARDPGRRFVVNTPSGTVEAVGTVFNMDLVQDGVTVTVMEGMVKVTSEKTSAADVMPQIAVEGEQVSIDPSGTMQAVKKTDVEKVTAWTRGKLIFSGESLREAIEKVNRYSKHRIDLRDTELKGLPLYGVFNAGDTAGFVSALKQTYRLRAVEISKNSTLLVKASGG